MNIYTHIHGSLPASGPQVPVISLSAPSYGHLLYLSPLLPIVTSQYFFMHA